jgi:hypothetical protein
MTEGSRGYFTPEEAARGDIPPRFAHITSVTYSADGKMATVVMLTNEAPVFEKYTVQCNLEDDQLWYFGTGQN